MSTMHDSHDTTPADAPQAAARLLELAANNADQLLDEARAEAASIVATAQAEADQLKESARTEADRILAAAHAEAEQVNSEVLRLQELEQEHRERMRSNLTQMLEQIDPTAGD